MSGVVHFKFRSALSYDSVSFDGHYISIGELKRLIADKKGLGADATAELELSDPQTKQPYVDESHQLPRNSSVVVRRVPAAKAPGRGPAAGARGGATTATPEAAFAPLSSAAAPAPAAATTSKAEFGEDPLEDEAARLKARYEEETSKIDAVVSAQDVAWKADTERNILAARGGRGGAGRGGRGMGRLRPNETYWCKICGERGQHWVQDCPRRNEVNLDLKIVRAPAGIPMTLLSRSTEGGLLLPNGEIGALKHADDAFEREMAGLPSADTRRADAALPALADKPAGERAPSPAVPALPAPSASIAAPDKSPAAAPAPSRLPVKLELQQQQQQEAAAIAAEQGPVESRALVLVEPAPGLFDDEELMAEADAAPAQLGLGMGMVVAEEQQPEGAKQSARKAPAPAQQHIKGERDAAMAEARALAMPTPQDPDELVPEDINRLLPLLKGILPRGPLGALLRAFKPGRPLSAEQFAELRADYGRPVQLARAPSGHSSGQRGSIRSPVRDHSRPPSSPVRISHTMAYRASRDGAFDAPFDRMAPYERFPPFERRPHSFERGPGSFDGGSFDRAAGPGFERDGGWFERGAGFERQPPIERRWRERSRSVERAPRLDRSRERSRERSVSRRDRSAAAAEAPARSGRHEEAVSDRHRRSSRDEPAAKLEERRSERRLARSEADAGRDKGKERERSRRGSGDGGQDKGQGSSKHGDAHDAHKDKRKARDDEPKDERSQKHSRTTSKHAPRDSEAAGKAPAAAADSGSGEGHAKRRHSADGTGVLDGNGVTQTSSGAADERWLETHTSMREASADLANLLDDDEPNEDVPASETGTLDNRSPAAQSPVHADVPPAKSSLGSHHASPARVASDQLPDSEPGAQVNAALQQERAEPLVPQQQEAAAEDAAPDRSPKRHGGSRRHHKDKKSSKHKSSHKSRKEKHKDRKKEEERAEAANGASDHVPSRHASRSPSRSRSPRPDHTHHAGDGHRHASLEAAAADETRQPSPAPKRAAAERPARGGLFGRALSQLQAGQEGGRHHSPAKRRGSGKGEEGDGAHDDRRSHKRSRRD